MKFIKRKNIDTYKPKSSRFTVEVDGRAVIDTDKTLTVPKGNTTARPSGVPGMIRYNTQIHEFEVFTDYESWGWETVRTTRPRDIVFQQIGTGQGDGTINTIIIGNGGGTGYASPPVIEISPPDVGTDQATATVSVSGGSIVGFTWINQGSGYLTVPTVTITGINQSATLTAVLTGALEYALPEIPVDSTGAISAKNVQVYVENVFQLPTINYTVTQIADTAYVQFDAPVPYGKPIYAILGFDR